MTHPTLVPESDTDADATFRNWMRLNLARAAAAPVGSRSHGPQRRHSKEVNGLVRAAFGRHRNLQINRWETVHGDLHWSNLLQPQLEILDWEMWGKGSAGTDAATLYCYSLCNPDISRRVHSEFEEILDSPDGATVKSFSPDPASGRDSG